MPDPRIDYDPPEGWNDTVVFKDNPSDAEVRPLFQRLFTQIQTFINTTLIAWVKVTFATKLELAGIALGLIPNNSLTEVQMANEMKKSVVGGVESYDTALLHRSDGTIHVTPEDREEWDGKATSAQGTKADNAIPNTSLIGSGTGGLRGTTLSTVAPSGGTDGDIWIKYI